MRRKRTATVMEVPCKVTEWILPTSPDQSDDDRTAMVGRFAQAESFLGSLELCCFTLVLQLLVLSLLPPM